MSLTCVRRLFIQLVHVAFTEWESKMRLMRPEQRSTCADRLMDTRGDGHVRRELVNRCLLLLGRDPCRTLRAMRWPANRTVLPLP